MPSPLSLRYQAAVRRGPALSVLSSPRSMACRQDVTVFSSSEHVISQPCRCRRALIHGHFPFRETGLLHLKRPCGRTRSGRNRPPAPFASLPCLPLFPLRVRPPLFPVLAIGGRVEATPNEKENDHETQQHQQPQHHQPRMCCLRSVAYHVVERAQDKRFWTRIGAAWPHEDGEGMTLQLDLVPAPQGAGSSSGQSREDEAGA